MDVEMEKRKFLNLCGKRDRALLSGEKRMTLGDMERLTYLTEFFELENYGIALWKEFGDDVKEPFEAMMKMLDEPVDFRGRCSDRNGEKGERSICTVCTDCIFCNECSDQWYACSKRRNHGRRRNRKKCAGRNRCFCLRDTVSSDGSVRRYYRRAWCCGAA